MYKGGWKTNMEYKRGHIVSVVRDDPCYYVCTLYHLSGYLTYPNREDVYWIQVDPAFLKDIEKIYEGDVQQKTDQPPFPFHLPNLPNLPNLPYDSEPVKLVSEEELMERNKRQKLKRKLKTIEENVETFKRQKSATDIDNLRSQLLLLNVDIATKSFLLDKYNILQGSSGGEYSKGMGWLQTVASLPFGRYKPIKVKAGDDSAKIQGFFGELKQKLDRSIFGLEDVKQEIMEFVARKITNPHSKGHVLALCGPPGCGKTKIIRSLADALDLPFCQINCGGLNDASVLIGHSETYLGSKPGKIVEFLQTSKFMNPIIYLDEIDKISTTKAVEINGVLTHLLDEEQNNKFQDNYLANVNINLSRALFVLAFNDISQIDAIVSDRLKVIYIEKPSLEDKIQICIQKIIPELLQTINPQYKHAIEIEQELIEYIAVKKCSEETGVRQLRKTMEKVLKDRKSVV